MASHGVPRASRPRTEEQRQRELRKIERYRGLEHSLREKITESQYDLETFHLTSNILRLNPEYYTVWNVRRRCLVNAAFQMVTENPGSAKINNGETDGSHAPVLCHAAEKAAEGAIRSELAFTVPLLMEFPKCYWIWKYRLWVLQEAIEMLPVEHASSVWSDELDLVGKMLLKDPRNFHAWGYRRHVVAQLESPVLTGKSMVEAEFNYTTQRIKISLSNFSAWHNRSQLIPRLLDETHADVNARRRLLDQELANLHEALNVGPEVQSLWYYHQYLVHAITEAAGEGPIVRRLPVEERRKYLEDEVAFLQDLLTDWRDIKWIYEAALECMRAAKKLSTDQEEQVNDPLAGEYIERLKVLDQKRRGCWEEIEGSILTH